MRKLLHHELLDQRLTNEQSLSVKRHPVSMILHNIRSLYNVGSIFRTADSALLNELILCGYTPFPPRKEIEKTALGATESVPWKYFRKTTEAITYNKNLGFKIAALELTTNKRNYFDLNINDFPLCIIAGNEISGIEDDVLELCDFAIEIPMYGVKHSLNVGVAAGIAIYEAIRICRYK